MKKEIRTKIVEREVFISNDGTEYNNENDAKIHDMILNGDAILCPKCNGKGKIEIAEQYEGHHNGITETMWLNVTCDKCQGKKYLKKIIKYE